MGDEVELANQCLGLCGLLVGQGRCYSLSLKLTTGFAFEMESSRYPAEKLASGSMTNDVLKSTKKKNPSRVRRDRPRRSLLLLKKREKDQPPLAVSPPSLGASLAEPGAGNQLLSEQEWHIADRKGKGFREAEEIKDLKVTIKRGRGGSFGCGFGRGMETRRSEMEEGRATCGRGSGGFGRGGNFGKILSVINKREELRKEEDGREDEERE